MGKPTKSSIPSYRDEATHDTASSSSAVLLDNIDYSDSDLPAYTDLPEYSEGFVGGVEASVPSKFLLPRSIPGGTLSRDESTISTIFPLDLENLIRQEMKYPPQYHMRIHGTHYETHHKSNDKSERKMITDFDVKVDLTHLLICQVPWHQDDPSLCYHATSENQQPCRYVKTLSDGERGYRGGIFPSKTPSPSSSDPEHNPPVDNVQAWTQAYSSSHHTMRTFTFSKKVTHHEKERLADMVKGLVERTNYRGHVQVSFPVRRSKVVVFSDCRLNRLRFNKYVCWFFYITFLWILSWPIIWLFEKKYKPVKIHYPYTYLAHDPTKPNPRPLADQAERPDPFLTRPLVETEAKFFGEWQLSINRAVMSKHQGWIDAVYRAESEQMARNFNDRAHASGTGFVDSLIQGVQHGVLGIQAVMGWGADS